MSRFKITDARLLLVGLISVVVFSIFTALSGSDTNIPPSSVRSDGKEGAMALRRWLEASGYEVREMVSSAIQPGDLDVIFVLNPSFYYTMEEAQDVYEWVRDGHTLIVAGNVYTVNSVLRPFNVSLFYLASDGGEQSLTSPTLTTPPFERLKLDVVYGIQSTRDDMVVHLIMNNTPVVASIQAGRGTVWIAGTVRPFTNVGLQDAASPRLIMNMLAGVPPGARIGFDEAQHGLDQTSETLSDWMFSSPAGWGILSALALTMTFLLLRGRRFGHTIPLREERLRREPVEYIQAMAHLLRRSGQRAETLGHYRARFLRELSRRYALDPGLDDAAIVRLVAARDASVDVDALRDLLAQLARPQVSEQDLVHIAMQVNDWTRKQH